MPTIETKRGRFWIANHRHDKSQLTSIVIHGAGGSHLSFPKELRHLKSANAIFPDLSGHGRSSGDGHQTIADYADDMLALLDILSIPEAVLMGHSMGGAIAQWLALEYPDRIHALVLMGSGAKLRVNPSLIEGIINDTETTIEQVNRWMWSKNVPDNFREKSIEMMKQLDPKTIQGDYIACDTFDVTHRLSQITMPTLIIAGEHDKMTPPQLSMDITDRIPNSELVIIPDGSHMMMLEKPNETTQTIDNWLNRL